MRTSFLLRINFVRAVWLSECTSLPPPQGRRQRRQAIVKEISKDILPAWDFRLLASELLALPLAQQGAPGAGPGVVPPEVVRGWAAAVRTDRKSVV